MRVALATCLTLPEVDPDESILLEALAKRGVAARMLAWDGDIRSEPGELVVIRSTWNYLHRVNDFLAWIDATAARTTVLNAPAVIRSNIDKHYLGDLEQDGIAIVPTAYVAKGERANVDAIRAKHGWDAFVIKPAISAGSFLTERFDGSKLEVAQRFLDEVSGERDVMVQKWMASVDTYGERSLVWIDGALSHAIRKSPRFVGGHEAVSAEVPIADDERTFAERLLDRTGRDGLLYARIDIVRDDQGVRLMELELIEPSLFLAQAPSALGRFADSIVARARQIA